MTGILKRFTSGVESFFCYSFIPTKSKLPFYNGVYAPKILLVDKISAKVLLLFYFTFLQSR